MGISRKKKKRSSPRIDIVFPIFRPDFIIISQKYLQQNETICANFEGDPSKKGGLRQLPHLPHPIFTTAANHLNLKYSFNLPDTDIYLINYFFSVAILLLSLIFFWMLIHSSRCVKNKIWIRLIVKQEFNL